MSSSTGRPFYWAEESVVYWAYEKILYRYKGAIDLSALKAMPVRERNYWIMLTDWREARSIVG
jgi:hypothetical protein